jgi:nucleoid-associated protein YgaU
VFDTVVCIVIEQASTPGTLPAARCRWQPVELLTSRSNVRSAVRVEVRQSPDRVASATQVRQVEDSMSAAPVEFDPTSRVDGNQRVDTAEPLDPAEPTDPAKPTESAEPTEWLADGCRLTATGVAPVIPLRPRDRQDHAPVARPRPPSRPMRHRRAGTRGPRYAIRPAPSGAWQKTWTLSRRGELLIRRVTAALVVLAVVGVVTALLVGVAGLVAPSAHASQTVVVQPGQSLWQIARAADPDSDVRDTVERIRTLNALPGADVRAGQQLIVPTG